MIDKKNTLEKLTLAFRLAISNIKIRYAMAVLGPLWISLNFIIVVSAIGLIYPSLFGVDTRSYLPFFACGYLAWVFFSTTVISATSVIVNNGPYITDRGIGADVFVMLNLFDQMVILAHTFPIVVVVFLMFGAGSFIGFLMCIPGLLLFILFTFGLSVMIAPLCVRFRDLPKIVESAMFALFVASPVLWDPKGLSEERLSILRMNPFFYLFEGWREPLLHQTFNIEALTYSLIFALVACVGAMLTRPQLANVAVWI